MELTQHPEYRTVYLHHQETDRHCRDAVATWHADGRPFSVDKYALLWTPDSALEFVYALSALFQQYNRVLWEHFSYCAQCGGQCCVVDASDIRPFDLIAIALLDEAAPSLPARIDAGTRACIYLDGMQCTWPTTWRTIKCWSFYCLGSGPWDSSASLGELYSAVTHRLQEVVAVNLPDQLRAYEAITGESLAEYLDDPVAFANAMHVALAEIFIAPLHARYPLFDLAAQQAKPASAHQRSLTADIFLVDNPVDIDVMSFISEAMEESMESPSAAPAAVDSSADQLLVDLEALAWLIEGQPANGPTLLTEILSRYENAPAPQANERESVWYRMRQQVRLLLNNQ